MTPTVNELVRIAPSERDQLMADLNDVQTWCIFVGIHVTGLSQVLDILQHTRVFIMENTKK